MIRVDPHDCEGSKELLSNIWPFIEILYDEFSKMSWNRLVKAQINPGDLLIEGIAMAYLNGLVDSYRVFNDKPSSLHDQLLKKLLVPFYKSHKQKVDEIEKENAKEDPRRN